jgi:hypothetical protein
MTYRTTVRAWNENAVDVIVVFNVVSMMGPSSEVLV